MPVCSLKKKETVAVLSRPNNCGLLCRGPAISVGACFHPGFLSGRGHIRDQWAWTVSECEASGRQTFVDCDAGDS